MAGKQLSFKHETQGTLFFNLLEIISIKKPKVIFLENVKNLVSHNNGETFAIIIKSLKNLGYYVAYKVLNSRTHSNVPHNRERIFIVGFLDKEAFDRFSFSDEIPLTTTVADFLETSVDESFYQTNLDSRAVQIMLDGITEKNIIYQFRRSYMRKSNGISCPTLTANMGTGGHNVPLLMDDKGVRKLTPRECFNLQGYSRDFVLPDISNSGLYKQAGNTVTVSLVQRIAKNIADAFYADPACRLNASTGFLRYSLSGKPENDDTFAHESDCRGLSPVGPTLPALTPLVSEAPKKMGRFGKVLGVSYV